MPNTENDPNQTQSTQATTCNDAPILTTKRSGEVAEAAFLHKSAFLGLA